MPLSRFRVGFVAMSMAVIASISSVAAGGFTSAYASDGLDTGLAMRPVCSLQVTIHCLALVLSTSDGTPASKLTSTTAGLTPSNLQAAYGVTNYTATGGVGRTVAIVDAFDDPKAESDMNHYRAAYRLPPCTTANGCFKKINQDGQPSPLPKPDRDWSSEISLDLDMVSALCPHCDITLVEANYDASRSPKVPDSRDMYTAEQAAFNEHPEAVSNSWAANEFARETQNDAKLVPADPRTVVLAAAGDSGYGVQYPAASPNVIAVGGTVLSRSDVTQSGWYETAWKGTGSGCSAYEPQPAGQNGVVSGCTRRVTNDVSAVAANLAIYDSYKYPGWVQGGGTSASTPIVAALITLAGGYVNSARDLYTAASTVGGFNDILTGSNGRCGASSSNTYSLCHAGVGYDAPTGLGSPAGITALLGPHRENMVVNGSFEADAFDFNGTLDLGGSNPLTGWTTLSNGTYPWGLPNTNVYTAGPTPYGNQWVIVGNYYQGGTWIEQTLNGLTVGQTYTLSFALASEEPNGGGHALVDVSYPSGSSTPNQTFEAPLTQVNHWDTWSPSSMSFQATSSSVTIRFTGLAGPGGDPGIDNVTVSI